MRRAFALVLLSVVFCTSAVAADSDIKSLTYVRWVDIGVPGNAAQLRPAEIRKLRTRCENWAMYFVPSGTGIEQVFVIGMTMGTVFPEVQVSHLSGETIFILVKDTGKTSDTLHLSKDGAVLTQFSPPFRPHTYLRCADAQVPAKPG